MMTMLSYHEGAGTLHVSALFLPRSPGPGGLANVIISVNIYTAYTAYIHCHGMQQRFLNITIVTLCECSQEISLWESD